MTKKPQKIRNIALLVAAGLSERMGGGLPKPYLKIGGQSILRRTIKAFMEHPEIDGVRVVIRREHHPLYRKAIDGLSIISCVIGGENRQESVRLGIESLAYLQPEKILVHDIARPFVSKNLISTVLAGLTEHKAIIPVLAITDTIKKIENGLVKSTLPRNDVFTVQTPQGFDYLTLMTAHKNTKGTALTDDSAVCEAAGIQVASVAGEAQNIKITTAEDIKQMENMLAMNSEVRVGIGYDVHALTEHDTEIPLIQRNVKLCGVRVPNTHRLVGHSDADVGLHALVDAILGAIGAGDIGMHFPPNDRKWLGADSERFLLHAYQLLKNKGGELINMDVTLICEKPKILPYREAMIEHIAKTLKIEQNRISIKATTTERLGFEGRGEGIAAQAVATVRLPRETA